ncbi:MAG: hydantoinase/oxoprolinase family protein [Alphaproteobacteria bacterium]|nr:hydantoinase/oxoprolinase family protein [Alphaproteobacteria bacterium]
MGRYALGIDIGGTFTDIVVYDHESGTQFNRKVLTTPDDPGRGVMAGIDQLLGEDGLAPEDFTRVVHATTLFTNALITRQGAKTGLITTEGFRDVLEIQRERKFELYDIFLEKPRPLVPRPLRKEVRERLAADGSEVLPLDEAGVIAAADELVAEECEAVAIVFLHAYANPAHEAAAARLIQARHPALFLSTSHEVSPQIREYDRASTTVVNAFVKPLAQRYLDHLGQEIAGRRIPAPFFLMLSNGGLTHVGEAQRTPVQLIESGPAAGALAAAFFGKREGDRRVLAFDMGGTTAKLSVVDDGEPLVAHGFEAAREKRFVKGSGLPISVSAIELIEIGAGGGSLARVDALGLLKVGPESAGSVPGPACYGRGGTGAAVTDADLILGYLDAGYFAGGSMRLDRDRALKAVAPLAAATGLDATGIAWGIYDVVGETMASAARVHIAERGKDPRDYALLATGGAGPVHVCHLALKLGIKRIVCPPAAGVASALGLLMAPARVDRVATMVQRLDRLDWPRFELSFRALEADARRVIADTGLAPERATSERLADIRYVGQGFEVVTPLPAGPYAAASEAPILAAFETAYRRIFTRTPPGVPVEVVNVRIAMRAASGDGALTLANATGGGGGLKGRRQAYFHEAAGFVDTPVYDRYRLQAGDTLNGPAVVEERESTLVLPPGATARVGESGSIVVTLG